MVEFKLVLTSNVVNGLVVPIPTLLPLYTNPLAAPNAPPLFYMTCVSEPGTVTVTEEVDM